MYDNLVKITDGIVKNMANTNQDTFNDFITQRYNLTPKGSSTLRKYFELVYDQNHPIGYTELSRPDKLNMAEQATFQDYLTLIMLPNVEQANAAPKQESGKKL